MDLVVAALAAAVAMAVIASLRDLTAHTGLSLTRDPLLSTVYMAQRPSSEYMVPKLLLESTALTSHMQQKEAISVSMDPISA